MVNNETKITNLLFKINNETKILNWFKSKMKAETERIHTVLVGFWLNQLKQKKLI